MSITNKLIFDVTIQMAPKADKVTGMLTRPQSTRLRPCLGEGQGLIIKAKPKAEINVGYSILVITQQF